MYKKYFKRGLDILLAIIFLIVTSPILILAFLILTVLNNGKAFFIQLRPGLDAKPFKIIKFRTMNEARDENGQLLSDELRLTGVGMILRKFSIDELPQMINVIKGDLSLIGPRPLLMDYLPLYSSQQYLRHSVKPGITGWAQVNGRNSSSWEQRFELDNYYVEHLSFGLDLKIFFMTIFNVIKMEGINSENSVSKEKFTGSK
jgi:lipopolysaccharide/colanic/teichoic acid biosynthesis glycosyltransferase